jgi:hypothetical protein
VLSGRAAYENDDYGERVGKEMRAGMAALHNADPLFSLFQGAGENLRDLIELDAFRWAPFND